MAASNLFKLLKEAIRDNSRTSTNYLLTEERVSESDSDLCSESNVGSYCSENAHQSILSSSSDSDTDLAEMNIKVSERKIFSQGVLGSDSSKSVREHKVTQKFCSNEENQQKKKNTNQSQCYNKKYLEIEFNMNLDNQQTENEFSKTHFYSNKLSESDFKTKECPQKEKEYFRSISYTDKTRCSYASQTRRSPPMEKIFNGHSSYTNRNKSDYAIQTRRSPPTERRFNRSSSYINRKTSDYALQRRRSPPKDKRFNRSSSYANRNTSNYALQMTENEADNEARRVMGEAAKFRRYTIKESMNDLSGCGVDVFKVFEYHRDFKKQIAAEESFQNASKRFEIDVPLTGVIAKMKCITREDIITDPPIPIEEEAWDDDLLF